MGITEIVFDNTEFKLYRYKDSPAIYWFESYSTNCTVRFPISSSRELLYYLNKFYRVMNEGQGDISIGRLNSGVYNFKKEMIYLKHELKVTSNWINCEDLKHLIEAVTFLTRDDKKRRTTREEIADIIHKIKKFTNKEVR